MSLYEARGMKVDALKGIQEHYLKLATPTDLERPCFQSRLSAA
jgi:hypothetical protein